MPVHVPLTGEKDNANCNNFSTVLLTYRILPLAGNMTPEGNRTELPLAYISSSLGNIQCMFTNCCVYVHWASEEYW